MKQSLLILTMLVILFSCKKEITPEQKNNSLIEKIKIQLKDSVAYNDFQQLDFDNAVITNYKKNNLSILRIPFLNKDFKSDFILLQVEKNQSFSRGKIINLVKDQRDTSSRSQLIFNGKLLIYSLSRKLTTNSPVTNGYVESFHPAKNINGKPLVVPVKEETLPEVVVVAFYPPNNEVNYSDWYNIPSFFNNSYDGGGSGGGGSGSSTGGYYTNGGIGDYIGGNPHETDPILIDFEPVENLQPIDVAKYLKCFSSIPDAGSTCTIKVLTDIPVDSDPTVFFSTANGSPGHTFLQITKTNGSQVVQQNIGFYPKEGWKSIFNLPVDGKFVDNADHEFNASLIESLTPDKFQKTLTHIVDLSKVIKYDLAQSNCTDFALNVFNYQRGANQLTITPYNIPGDSAPNGTSTPQGVYMKLKSIKQNATDPDSKNVALPGLKGFVGDSHGPCN